MGYLYSTDEIDKIKKEVTLFVFDTNVWLDLYTLPKKCVDEILHGFTWRTDMIWLPNQVFIEFKNNYKSSRGTGSFKPNLKCNLEEVFKKFEDSIDTNFKIYKEKEIIEVPQINQLKNHILQEIQLLKGSTFPKANEIFENIKKLNSYSEKNDDIEILINALRRSSHANGFKVLELLKIYEEGEVRFKYNTPPGFMDKEKPNNKKNETTQSKYGDLILWKELLQKGKESKCNLVLVQNEKKADWWDMSNNARKIPKVMIEEFDEVKGKESNKFLMMDFNEFLFHFSSYFEIPATTIEEINNKIKIIDKIKEFIIHNRNRILKDSHYLDIMDEYVKPVMDKKAKEMCFIDRLDKVVSVKFNDLYPLTCEFLKEHFSRRIIFKGSSEMDGEIVVNENETNKKLIYRINCKFDFIMEVFIINLDEKIDDNTYSDTIDITNINEISDFKFVRELMEDDPDYNYYIF